MFTGDERDETASITIDNFNSQSHRLGAKEMRAVLSQMSDVELVKQARAVRDKNKPSELARIAEQIAKEKAARELRDRQSKRGSRPRLQPGILAAARHYRQIAKKNAKEAWLAIRETPFKTDDGSTVEIKGDKRSYVEDDECFVRQPDGRQLKRSIKWDQWRQVYWKAAAKPG
jgi:hypothetical protein